MNAPRGRSAIGSPRAFRTSLARFFKPARAVERGALGALGRAMGASRRVHPGPTLRILTHVSSFVPVVRGGAEVSLATTLTMLADRGHEVRVLVDQHGA